MAMVLLVVCLKMLVRRADVTLTVARAWEHDVCNSVAVLSTGKVMNMRKVDASGGYTRQEEAVYSLLARTGGEWYTFEIVHALASTQAVVREALKGLVDHGWVLDRICGEEYRYHACF